MIELLNVSKRYPNGTHALNRISTIINQGEFVYVVGPSGSGKTTFLKTLYREEKVTSGSIFVGRYDLSKIKSRQIPLLRRYVGVVFQDFKLLPQLTVYENVAYAMEVVGKRPKEIKQRVQEVVNLVGLSHKLRTFPSELSGGEQQRVAIARAIANMPNVLVADEPTGNLDPETSMEIMHILQRVNDQGTTVIMATHNRTIVNTIRNRVIAIENGQIVRDERKGEYGYDDH